MAKKELLNIQDRYFQNSAGKGEQNLDNGNSSRIGGNGRKVKKNNTFENGNSRNLRADKLLHRRIVAKDTAGSNVVGLENRESLQRQKSNDTVGSKNLEVIPGKKISVVDQMVEKRKKSNKMHNISSNSTTNFKKDNFQFSKELQWHLQFLESKNTNSSQPQKNLVKTTRINSATTGTITNNIQYTANCPTNPKNSEPNFKSPKPKG